MSRATDWTYLTTRTDLEPGSWLSTGKGSMVVRERLSLTSYKISSPTTWELVVSIIKGAVVGLWLDAENRWLDVVLWWDDAARARLQRPRLLRAGLARPPAGLWRLIAWRLGF